MQRVRVTNERTSAYLVRSTNNVLTHFFLMDAGSWIVLRVNQILFFPSNSTFCFCHFSWKKDSFLFRLISSCFCVCYLQNNRANEWNMGSMVWRSSRSKRMWLLHSLNLHFLLRLPFFSPYNSLLFLYIPPRAVKLM